MTGIGLDLGRKRGYVEITNDMYTNAVVRALIEVGLEGIKKEMMRFDKMAVPAVPGQTQERVGVSQ